RQIEIDRGGRMYREVEGARVLEPRRALLQGPCQALDRDTRECERVPRRSIWLADQKADTRLREQTARVLGDAADVEGQAREVRLAGVQDHRYQRAALDNRSQRGERALPNKRNQYASI